jgi:hypothetical protein
MWIGILSFMVGGLLGFFIAGILAASRRFPELDPELYDLALGERWDGIQG